MNCCVAFPFSLVFFFVSTFLEKGIRVPSLPTVESPFFLLPVSFSQYSYTPTVCSSFESSFLWFFPRSPRFDPLSLSLRDPFFFFRNDAPFLLSARRYCQKDSYTFLGSPSPPDLEFPPPPPPDGDHGPTAPLLSAEFRHFPPGVRSHPLFRPLADDSRCPPTFTRPFRAVFVGPADVFFTNHLFFHIRRVPAFCADLSKFF